MKTRFTLLFLAMSAVVFSQAPQSIPYQAVIRNTDGSAMANAAVTITFKIHDYSATGTVVYEETHTTTTNAQGLVSLNVGGGTAVTGTFSGIQWGTGNKFLQVLMNAGNVVVDLGTQQMMSVPYALYAEDVNVRVSVTGDSLFIGDQVSIVPGVSAANPPALYTMGNGVNDIDGNYYPSIIINGQEWMQKNLTVTKYRNGDAILTALDSVSWYSLENGEGAFSMYNNSLSNSQLYGNLYNWYAVNDPRGLCPTGWHVPTDNEWLNLENSLGGTPGTGLNSNTIASDKMRNEFSWGWGQLQNCNQSGFSALPSGNRGVFGSYSYLGGEAHWWTSTNYSNIDNYNNVVGPVNMAWDRALGFEGLGRFGNDKRAGLSVRCKRDENNAQFFGCTDYQACNYVSIANIDDGSCTNYGSCFDDYFQFWISDSQSFHYYNYAPNSCQCTNQGPTTGGLRIGDEFQGGRVFYFFKPGDLGYVNGETHGLIASNFDLSGLYEWGCIGIDVVGAENYLVGTGDLNTNDLITANCNPAATTCGELFRDGYDDWFLPNVSELRILLSYFYKFGGGLNGNLYLSSSEFGGDYYSDYSVWSEYYSDVNSFLRDVQVDSPKNLLGRFRPIRKF